MSSVGSSVRSAIGRIGDPFEERASGGLPELVGRQPDGGEGWVEIGGERDVVEADDADVVGHARARPRAARRWRRGRRRRWRRRRRRTSVRSSSVGHRRVAARGVEGGLGDELRVGIDAGRASSACAVAVQALLGGGVDERRVGDAGDPAMAERRAGARRRRGRRRRCRRRRWRRRRPAGRPGGRPGSRRGRARRAPGRRCAGREMTRPSACWARSSAAYVASGPSGASGSTMTRNPPAAGGARPGRAGSRPGRRHRRSARAIWRRTRAMTWLRPPASWRAGACGW